MDAQVASANEAANRCYTERAEQAAKDDPRRDARLDASVRNPPRGSI